MGYEKEAYLCLLFHYIEKKGSSREQTKNPNSNVQARPDVTFWNVGYHPPPRVPASFSHILCKAYLIFKDFSIKPFIFKYFFSSLCEHSYSSCSHFVHRNHLSKLKDGIMRNIMGKHISVFTNTFQTLPDIRSGAVMNFTRPNNILQDQKKNTNKLNV